jgi:hypothetical protein
VPMRAWVVGALAVLLLVACRSTGGDPVPAPTTAASTSARCPTPTRFGKHGAAPHEVHGLSANGSIWGLALGPGHIPPHAGDELKIVWRVTGHGPLHVVFSGPNRNSRPLVFGPQRHDSGSSYDRPGEEWGTGFRFGTKGCWHIHLARNDTTGDVWIDV